MNRLQIAKQRIMESNLPRWEKIRLLENYQKFEDLLEKEEKKITFFIFII